MLKKRKLARFEKGRQSKVHASFTDIIPNGDIIQQWTTEVKHWEKSRRDVPSLYKTVVKRESSSVYP